jgi:hypothetical protein
VLCPRTQQNYFGHIIHQVLRPVHLHLVTVQLRRTRLQLLAALGRWEVRSDVRRGLVRALRVICGPLRVGVEAAAKLGGFSVLGVARIVGLLREKVSETRSTGEWREEIR